MAVLCTLHYLINVGVRLSIFHKNFTLYALIPYHTFINFMKTCLPVLLIHISKFIFSKWLCNTTMILEIFYHLFHTYDSNMSLRNCSIKCFILFWGYLLLKRKFPPCTLIGFWKVFHLVIPYHTFIFLKVNFHPIWLFHTLRLLDSLE